MTIGDIHVRVNTIGNVVYETRHEELAGHDPANDIEQLKLLSPIRVTGTGFVTVELVDPVTRELIAAFDFDVSVVEGEWDEYRLNPPQLRTANENVWTATISSDQTNSPHRPRQQGQTTNATPR